VSASKTVYLDMFIIKVVPVLSNKQCSGLCVTCRGRPLTSHSDQGTQQHSNLYVVADLTHEGWAAYYVQDSN